MGVKICIIGAGSAVFSLSLIKDICLTPKLKDSTICLMDIDEGRLADAYTLCTRYADEVGIALDIERTLDRRSALSGADFVINTALATGPGHERLRAGWKLAFQLGYRFGGSLHIIHDEAFWINFYQLRLMESILRDVLELCPKAWYVLVANPVLAGVTYLTRKYRDARIVGMCHGYGGVYDVAETLGLERTQIDFEIPGVNHFVWLTKFLHQGRDAYPLLDEWIEKRSAQYFRGCRYCDGMGPKAVDLYRRFGAFPIGDTGSPGGGAWGYWYHQDRKTEKRWREDPKAWYDGYFVWGLRNVARIRQVANDASIRVTEAYPETQSGEPMIPLIEALACDVERTVVVNVPNGGNFVEGVPLDFEVEVPATVNAQGVFGRKTQKLPAPILSFLHRDRVVPVELELKAFESGERRYLFDLILTDPWTTDGEQAERLIDGILALPQHREMREHFR
jgi:alpha-galactosidase